MILNNKSEELNLAFKLRVDNFDYVVFGTSDTMKYFGCGKEGHLIRACPERISTSRQSETEKAASGGNKNQSNIQQLRQESQVSERGEEETGGLQQDSQMGEGGEEETGGVQQKSHMSKERQEETGIGRKLIKQVDICENKVYMDGDDEALKVLHLKRKTRSNSRKSQARKGTVKMTNMEEDSVADSGSESSDSKMVDSQKSERTYSAGKIKVFLQRAKNMKGMNGWWW